MSDIEISRMLTCITSHMTETEAQAMGKGESEIDKYRTVWKAEYGFIFWIGGAVETNYLLAENVNLSPGLRDAIIKGVESECEWIRFDRDAEPLEGVHVYDW